MQRKLLKLAFLLKRAINALKLERLPPVRKLTQRVKERYFATLNRPEMLELDGMQLFIPKRLISHYSKRQYEPLTTQAMKDFLEPGMVAVDVGAHLGYFTILMANLVKPGGIVYAIEPCKDNVDFLMQNIRRNDLDNVIVLNHAIGRVNGSREFHITNSSDCHGFFNHPLKPTIKLIDVLQLPLDEAIPHSIDFIKIDIEGAEVDALMGMKQILKGDRFNRLVVEWNPTCLETAGVALEELPSLLSSMGFQLKVLNEKSKCIQEVEDVLESLRKDRPGPNWYVNLLGWRRN